jgi:hypothetical protein
MVQSNRASAFRLLTSVTFQKALCDNNFPSSFLYPHLANQSISA